MSDNRLGSVFVAWVRGEGVATEDRQVTRESMDGIASAVSRMRWKYPKALVRVQELWCSEEGELGGKTWRTQP